LVEVSPQVPFLTAPQFCSAGGRLSSFEQPVISAINSTLPGLYHILDALNGMEGHTDKKSTLKEFEKNF